MMSSLASRAEVGTSLGQAGQWAHLVAASWLIFLSGGACRMEGEWRNTWN